MATKETAKAEETQARRRADQAQAVGPAAMADGAAALRRLAGPAGSDRPVQLRRLQQTAGNRAVRRLIAPAPPQVARLPRTPAPDLAPADPAAPAAGGARQLPPAQTGAISRTQFEQLLSTHFGVNQVHDGTMAQQEATLRAQSGNASFSFAPAGWRAWNPGSSSAIYSQIVNGFRDFVNSFGGLPQVNEVIFHAVSYRYDRATGRAVPEPNVGGSFGGGTLAIFQRALSGGLSIPEIISHELGHGMVEIGLTPGAAGAPAPDPALITDYKQAVGWSAGGTPQLFDIGVPAVATAIAAGRAPDARYRITSQNWADPRWQEKPISAYMTTHPSEDLPEAIRGYVHQRSLLQSNSPRRFAFVAARIGRLYPHLRQIAPDAQQPQQGDFPAGPGNMG